MSDACATPDHKLLGPFDISDEEWREYQFPVNEEGTLRTMTYRITGGKQLYYRVGGSTHRVVDDDGVVHCVPAPGVRGCVLRWKGQVKF